MCCFMGTWRVLGQLKKQDCWSLVRKTETRKWLEYGGFKRKQKLGNILRQTDTIAPRCFANFRKKKTIPLKMMLVLMQAKKKMFSMIHFSSRKPQCLPKQLISAMET